MACSHVPTPLRVCLLRSRTQDKGKLHPIQHEPRLRRSLRELQKRLRNAGTPPEGAKPFSQEYYEALVNWLLRVSEALDEYMAVRDDCSLASTRCSF